MKLNEAQVKQYLYNAGFKGVNLQAAVKICYCESSFNTHAHNTTGEDSRGLMQINVASNANPQYKHLNLFDPVINTTVAYQIYNRTKDFRAWTCADKLNLVNPTEIYFGIALVFIGIATYISIAQ
jgi:hypothetical protein